MYSHLNPKASYSSSSICNMAPALQTCFQCLRCKSCGKSDVSHYLDGTPLCAVCCLQTKKGSYCPLCSGCYDDDDYDTRMMGKSSSACDQLQSDQSKW